MKRALLVITSFVSFLAVGPLTGCSGPTDPTMNRPDPTPLDPNYPVGPYGYVEGSTVEDYKFVGKTPSGGDYASAAVRDLYLGEFHDDASVKALLIVGAAVWCGPCNQEAPAVEALASSRHSDGFRTLTILAEGVDYGSPSTAADIQTWFNRYDIKSGGMGIDPEGRLFKYASTSAFPLQILLDTRTMKIKWLCVGGAGQGGCDVQGSVDAILSAP
jgi:hypothetical protein